MLEVVRCPQCHGRPGDAKDAAWVCSDCSARYPLFAGIPWLFRDVAGSRTQWAAKLQRFQADLNSELGALEEAASAEGLADLARDRLTRKRAGLEKQAQQIFSLLEPFAFSHAEAGGGIPRDRIPSRQHVTSYLETAFRDWVWGDDEIREAVALVQPAFETRTEKTPERALVLGGGAGRLAYEIAASATLHEVFQVDLNPLLTRIGAIAAGGTSIELSELPRFPVSIEDVSVDQVLRAPKGSLEGKTALHYLLGDAFALPFAPGTFDLLVTPWFIDILPEPFEDLSLRLGEMLAVGGRWVSFGPLSFESVDEKDRLTPEEITASLTRAGFEVEASRHVRVDYLHSPHNMARRGEEVFLFSAVRREAKPIKGGFSFYPDWMLDGTLPIPSIPEFERQQAEKIFDLEILKCIDGRTSIEGIVAALSSRYGLETDRCRNAVDRFFSRTIEED